MNDTVRKSPATRDDVAAFYNNFGTRLLRDYVKGNRRVDRAIDRVCSNISNAHSRILDVGCGIGASTMRYKQQCPWITVHGVDISSNNIKIANALFGDNEGIEFSVSAMEQSPADCQYDVIAMIDVYEHIPRDNWKSFNGTLADCLAPNGLIAMTTPSPFHQQYLAEHDPAGLQIVDECVTLHDILELQQELNGTLTEYALVDVWNTNDYLHVVIDRDPKYSPIKRKTLERHSLRKRIGSRLFNARRRRVKERRNHVKTALGIDIT